jgi:EmrB/QacA subfamily drug resistance transporter
MSNAGPAVIPDPPAPSVHPALVLAVLAVASFLAQLDVWITNVGLPNIGAGVGESSLSALSWVLNGYAIVYAALLVPAGRVADRFGRKGSFVVGLAIFGAASIGAAFSGSVEVLVGFRVLQAVGAALLTPASLGLVLTSAPPEKVGQYVKVWFTAGALAGATGPVLGGLLVEISWRWLFLINIPLVVLAIAATVRIVPNARHEQDARIPDLLGGLVLMGSVGAFSLALVKAPDWGWGSAGVVASLALSVVGTAIFLRRSARHAVPVVDLELFKDRVFSASNLVAALSMAAFSLVLLSSILWLQGHWHYSAIRTGFATAPAPVAFAVGAATAESLTVKYRVAVNRIAIGGLLIAAAGVLTLAQTATEDVHWLSGFFPGFLVTGVGFGLAVPSAISAATADLRPAQAATGSAVVSMATQIGAVVGVSLLVAILGVSSATAALSSFQAAWYAGTGLTLVAILGAVAIVPRIAQDDGLGSVDVA